MSETEEVIRKQLANLLGAMEAIEKMGCDYPYMTFRKQQVLFPDVIHEARKALIRHHRMELEILEIEKQNGGLTNGTC